MPKESNIENKICISLFSMTDHINDISIPYNLRQNHSYVKNFIGNGYAHIIALSV